MKINFFVLVFAFLLLTGCALNVSKKEINVTTGAFGGNLQKMRAAFNQLKQGMTDEEVNKAGFGFELKNVECVRSAKAMPFVVGDVKNNVDLSTEEKIDEYAKTISVYKVCFFPEQKLKSEKQRLFWSSRKEKTKGPEWIFMLIFKRNILLDHQVISQGYKDKIEKESAFGGNILENIIGLGTSAGRKFR